MVTWPGHCRAQQPANAHSQPPDQLCGHPIPFTQWHQPAHYPRTLVAAAQCRKEGVGICQLLLLVLLLLLEHSLLLLLLLLRLLLRLLLILHIQG